MAVSTLNKEPFHRRAASGARWRVVAISLAVLAAIGVLGLRSCDANAAPAELDSSNKIFGVTKESSGAVTVALTPRRHADGQLFVDIAVNTHTVNDLDKYDLKTMVTLEVHGHGVAPTSAPLLRGHHNSGQLVFPLAAMPGSFAIKIRGLDQPAMRVLSWP